jgi:hypothetical protein
LSKNIYIVAQAGCALVVKAVIIVAGKLQINAITWSTPALADGARAGVTLPSPALWKYRLSHQLRNV